MFTKQICSFIREKLHVVSDDNIVSPILLTDGKSGAEVYRTKIISLRESLSGTYVIKLISTNSLWYSARDNEAEKSKLIHDSALSFSDRLVRLSGECVVDGYHVLIYRQANESVLNTAALDKLATSEQMTYLKSISYELLHIFNEGVTTVQNSSDYFANLLAYRLEGDLLSKKLEKIVEKPSCPAIAIGGVIYPNPYYYLNGKDKWHNKITTLFFKKNIHGDLHRRNILCTKDLSNAEQLQYSIIDYDSFSNESYIFFDHAYLELSIYLDEFPNNDLKQWINSIAPLVTSSIFTDANGEPDNKSLYLRNAICWGIHEWTAKHYPGLKDDVSIQFYMARIAAGINFFCKKAIIDNALLVKIILFTSLCLKQLFEMIGFVWDQNNVTGLLRTSMVDDKTEIIWEKCLKFSPNYINILLSDFDYSANEFASLSDLRSVDWSLVIDIGSKKSPDYSNNPIIKSFAESCQNLTICNLIDAESRFEYIPNSCAWLIARKAEKEQTYGQLWVKYQSQIKDVLKQIHAYYGRKSVLIVFDSKKSLPFAQRFLHHMTDEGKLLPPNSRIIEIRENVISQDDMETLTGMSCHSIFLAGMTLPDVAATAVKYLPGRSSNSTKQVVLKSLEHLNGTLTENEVCRYATNFELVYSGLESTEADIDFGETFYRGGEIKWSDLAYNCDIRIVDNYDDVLNRLRNAIEKETPRVKSRRLLHGAGTGGTTLSKRLLWDLKEDFPSLRLKHYTNETANIILEIYRKTGKCVFITVEIGSTVISKDELRDLMTAVNASYGRALFLQVERSNGDEASIDDGAHEEKAITTIPNTLDNVIARRFNNKFSKWTMDDKQKIDVLTKITSSNDSEWYGQRCAFFYGFYTFGKNYNLSNIERTVQECSEKDKALLSDLSLITVYSQNICVRYSELPLRLGFESGDVNPYYLDESLEDAVRKIIVKREEGWRICHPLIAEKILQTIYNTIRYQDSTYEATVNFINAVYSIYGDNDAASDNILKELLIDRAFIDVDEKAKFSQIIEAIPQGTKKEELFKKLIDLYPKNPHYYNHLARLFVFRDTPDYNKAINLLNTALRIADECNLDPSVHYTTLGVVYSKKILLTLKNERQSIMGYRFSRKIPELIIDIQGEYALADGAFIEARNKKLRKDSYQYFPNIGMECSLIERIVGCDKDRRSRQQLIKDDPSFKAWFEEHYGKAAQLLTEMEVYCYASENHFLERAKQRLKSISDNDWNIKKELAYYNKSDTRESLFPRRAYSSAIYINNGYSWDGLAPGDLKLVEEAMRKNLTLSSRSEHTQRDVYYWFEVFRRIGDFDPGEAIRFIADYMNNGYEKSYVLFMLHFLRMEKGLASHADVTRYINECKAQIPPGISTAAFKDAYSSTTHACPVIPHKYVSRQGEAIIGLRDFYGIITSVSGATKGTILMDTLGLDVLFTPSFTNDAGTKMEFTASHIANKVKYNLMFSYSGLRAWNVSFVG